MKHSIALQLMVRLLHGMGIWWNENGLEMRMRMKFQCLLDKNKWKCEYAVMSSMYLLGKINRNENQFTKIPIVLNNVIFIN